MSFVEDFLNETIMYGGLPHRRGDVYGHIMNKFDNARMADFFAMRPKAVSAEPFDISIQEVDEK